MSLAVAANASNATETRFICGVLVEPGVLANALSACEDDFPSDLVDWHVDRMPGMVPYYKFFGAIGFMIVVANTLIIVGVLRDVKLRKQLFLLQIVGQAVTDFNVGMLIFIFTFGTMARDWVFLGEEVGCSFYGYAITGTCHCTVFSLTWIAYVRREKVLNNRNVSFKTMKNLYVFGVLGGMFVMAFYYALVTKSRLVSSGSFCNPIYNWPVLIPAALAICCPIAYIVVTYYKVNKMMVKTMAAAKKPGDEARKGKRFGFLKINVKRPAHLLAAAAGRARRASVAPAMAGTLTLNTTTSKTVRKLSVNTAELKRAKQQARATRLMIFMCASILVLWIPLYIYFAYVVGMVITGKALPGMEIAEMCLGLAASSSSLCSPVIYGFSNRTMRNAMLFAFLPLEWKEAYAKRDKKTSGFWYMLRRNRFVLRFLPTKLMSSVSGSSIVEKRPASSIFESDVARTKKTMLSPKASPTSPKATVVAIKPAVATRALG